MFEIVVAGGVDSAVRWGGWVQLLSRAKEAAFPSVAAGVEKISSPLAIILERELDGDLLLIERKL